MTRPIHKIPTDWTEEEKARFWSNVDVGDPNRCWPWIGGRNSGNYGEFKLRGLQYRAHRCAYTISLGAIPDGGIVRHGCDNPPCCNPAHLIAGSYLDNALDKVERGRCRNQYAEATHCPRGHTYDDWRPPSHSGARRCRQCHNENNATRRKTPEYRAKQAAYMRQRRKTIEPKLVEIKCEGCGTVRIVQQAYRHNPLCRRCSARAGWEKRRGT
jgi:ribosomal protein S27E